MITCITKAEMSKVMKRMKSIFPTADGIPNDVFTIRTNEYYEALKGFSYAEVEKAVDDAVREETFFPSLASLLGRCKVIREQSNNRINIDGINFTREELAQIKKENKYRQLAEKTMEKMTQKELAPYRQRAIDEIGFKGGRINSVGEMGIFWHIRESIRKELMGEGQFTLKKGVYF